MSTDFGIDRLALERCRPSRTPDDYGAGSTRCHRRAPCSRRARASCCDSTALRSRTHRPARRVAESACGRSGCADRSAPSAAATRQTCRQSWLTPCRRLRLNRHRFSIIPMKSLRNCVAGWANVQFARQNCQLMIHVIVAVFAVFGALWALAIWLVGGFTIALPGVTIQSHDPFRPLAVGAIAAAHLCRDARAAECRGASRHRSPFFSRCALRLPASRATRGRRAAPTSTRTCRRPSCGCSGNLTVPVPLAATAPWPERCVTFAPHGFRPAVSGPALVPVTAPGLPLLMAAAKAIAGHCAMFLVTPLSGALLVWVTFLIGRRLESDALGLAAAWLVATSPAVLAMLVSPMSDVPAAAFWAIAIYFALGHTQRSALFAGLAASAAILIRPNLAPLAVVLVIWKFWSGQRATTRQSARSHERQAVQAFRPVLPLIAGTIPGCLFIAWINNTLYGSPLASGYGSLSALFSLSHIATNLRAVRRLARREPDAARAGRHRRAVRACQTSIWRTRDQQRAAPSAGCDRRLWCGRST